MTRVCLIGRIAAPMFLAAAALATVAARPAQAQTLIASYSFDDTTAGTTTTVANSGSLDATALNMVTWTTKSPLAVASKDLLNGAVKGVSGQSQDTALYVGDNFSSGGGNQYGGVAAGGNTGSAVSAASYADFDPHSHAFTIVGWYDGTASSSATSFVSGTRLMDGSVTLAFTGSGATLGTLQVQLGSGSAPHIANSTATYNTTLNKWNFFAVTWDPTTSTVNFYNGDTSTAVSLLGTAVTGVTSTGALTGGASETFGNTATMTRAFDGYLDNIGMYSGVLTSSQLEVIRQANLTDSMVVLPSASPEPTSLALAGIATLGTGLPLLHRRRRREK